MGGIVSEVLTLPRDPRDPQPHTQIPAVPSPGCTSHLITMVTRCHPHEPSVSLSDLLYPGDCLRVICEGSRTCSGPSGPLRAFAASGDGRKDRSS